MKLALSLSVLVIATALGVAIFAAADGAPSSTAATRQVASGPPAGKLYARRFAALGLPLKRSPAPLLREAAALVRGRAEPPATRRAAVEAYLPRLDDYLRRLRSTPFPAPLRAFARRTTHLLSELRAVVGAAMPLLHPRGEPFVGAYVERARGVVYELTQRLRRALAEAPQHGGGSGGGRSAAS